MRRWKKLLLQERLTLTHKDVAPHRFQITGGTH